MEYTNATATSSDNVETPRYSVELHTYDEPDSHIDDEYTNMRPPAIIYADIVAVQDHDGDRDNVYVNQRQYEMDGVVTYSQLAASDAVADDAHSVLLNDNVYCNVYGNQWNPECDISLHQCWVIKLSN